MVVVVFAVVLNGDVERRCESNRFNVSLATEVVVVVGVVVDVRQGVFITSRTIGGIDAAFDDAGGGTTFVSGIDVIGSGTIVALFVVVVVVTGGVAAVETGVVVDPPLATSSITSSMCDREAGAAGAIVGDCFSPVKFDDETIFETNVITSAD